MREDVGIDRIGLETFTYRELAATVARIRRLGRQRILSIPPTAGYFVGSVLGRLKIDILISWEEILGLIKNLLYFDSPPAGAIRLTDWIVEHAETLARCYASERNRATGH